MYDVIALGESLIDFTPSGCNERGMQLFSRNPGGAPANVLAMNAKLGGKTAFIGKVGSDDFGRFLESTMAEAGIDCQALQKDPQIPTTLAFVQLDEKGDRSFTFYRKPGADMMLCKDEVDPAFIRNCRVFHFGSVSMTDEPCRTATLSAVRIAREGGCLISYDPNYRPFLWDSAQSAREAILAAVPLSDLLKVSEEEMELLTGETNLQKGAKKLSIMGPKVVFVTLGEKGAYCYTPAGDLQMQTFAVKAVDTTGAGDAFWGAMLHYLLNHTDRILENVPMDVWAKAMEFANAAGSLTTETPGAIPAMPDMEQICTCIRSRKKNQGPVY